MFALDDLSILGVFALPKSLELFFVQSCMKLDPLDPAKPVRSENWLICTFYHTVTTLINMTTKMHHLRVANQTSG